MCVPARHWRPSPAGAVLAVGQQAGTRGFDVEAEHVADAGERERPLTTVAAHPGLGVGGELADLRVAALASPVDAPCRLFQDGEHEDDRSGCSARPLRVNGDLRGQDHHGFEKPRLKLVAHRLLPSFRRRAGRLTAEAW